MKFQFFPFVPIFVAGSVLHPRASIQLSQSTSESTFVAQQDLHPPEFDFAFESASPDISLTPFYEKLVIRDLPRPPSHLFVKPNTNNQVYEANKNGLQIIGRPFVVFFFDLRELVKRPGFDGISYITSSAKLTYQYEILKLTVEQDHLLESTQYGKLFQICSYYHQLMNMYVGLLQEGLCGGICGLITDHVVMIMKQIDVEISMLYFLDFRNIIMLRICSDFVKERFLSTKQRLNTLRLDLEGLRAIKSPIFSSIVTEQEKLVQLMERLEKFTGVSS